MQGGGQLTKRQHLLSRDGKLLLACAASDVRAYSASTGEHLFTLSGHTDEVTSLSLHPERASQVGPPPSRRRRRRRLRDPAASAALLRAPARVFAIHRAATRPIYRRWRGLKLH
jgi:hypothetical protein